VKVVLVHGKFWNSWEALGLGYMAAYVHQYRPTVKFAFFQACFDSNADIYAACREADVVAFSCTSPAFKHAASLLPLIRKANPGIRAVIGGYHASALPQECLAAGFNQVVIGEGEQALMSIVDGYKARVVYGPPQRFESLPWPNRRLIRNERNIEVAAKDTGKRITSFQAHRGCPFLCKFCADGAEKVMFGGQAMRLRHRPVDDLIEEICSVASEYRLDYFKFCDPTWNASAAWVDGFCEAKQRSPVAALPFFANLHANCVTPEMVGAMRAAGCADIGIGIESGAEKVLASIGKGTTRESIARACAAVKGAGIHARGYFILGMPNETEADLEATERFAEELDLDEYGFSLLCPYPGTVFYDLDRHGGIDWSKTDEYQNDFWRAETVSNARLKEWQARLKERFSKRITWHQRQEEPCLKS
jgi:radical SAM superfamily enzyme YgiQ (UPF0313 family)